LKRNYFKQHDFPKSTSFSNQTFQVNRSYVDKEFYQDYNRSHRDWFFSYFSKDMQQLFKNIYYTQLAKIKDNTPFFDWLNDFLPKPNFNS